jgi:predicted nucleic acid-binding protein
MGEDTLVLSEALAIYDAWLEDPRVEFAMELRNTDSSFRQAIAPFATQPATKAIADCYLIAVAEVHGASIATLDKALVKTAQMRQVPTVLLGS